MNRREPTVFSITLLLTRYSTARQQLDKDRVHTYALP